MDDDLEIGATLYLDSGGFDTWSCGPKRPARIQVSFVQSYLHTSEQAEVHWLILELGFRCYFSF